MASVLAPSHAAAFLRAVPADRLLSALAHANGVNFFVRGVRYPNELVFRPDGLMPAVVLRAQQMARFMFDRNPSLRDTVVGAELQPGFGLLGCVSDQPVIEGGDPTPRAFFRAVLLQRAAVEVFGWGQRTEIEVLDVQTAFEQALRAEGLAGLLEWSDEVPNDAEGYERALPNRSGGTRSRPDAAALQRDSLAGPQSSALGADIASNELHLAYLMAISTAHKGESGRHDDPVNNPNRSARP